MKKQLLTLVLALTISASILADYGSHFEGYVWID